MVTEGGPLNGNSIGIRGIGNLGGGTYFANSFQLRQESLYAKTYLGKNRQIPDGVFLLSVVIWD